MCLVLMELTFTLACLVLFMDGKAYQWLVVVMVVSNSSYEMWYASEYPLLKDMSRESAIVLPSFLWASSGHMLAPVRIKDWIR